MKKLICAIISAIFISACALAGCRLISTPRDGIDGQDLSIYDIYEATNSARAEQGLEQLDFLEFLREYLNYNFEYAEDDLQHVINRSLLSSVSIFPGFKFAGERELLYGGGSGVIVDLDKSSGNAYILTNAHVVLDFEANPNTPMDIVVYLYGSEFTYDELENVELVTYSISYDVALLKVTNSTILKNSDARAAVFAESEDVYVGEKVYTIGNPGAMGISVTQGIISKESEYIAIDFAEGTAANNQYRVIRTDAATNAGNSGGALYDGSGRIVGVVNSKDGDANNENMGFALCGSYVKRIWKLMRDGYLSTNGKYGIRCAVFPAAYEYSSTAFFNSQTNLTEIRDFIQISRPNGDLRMGDMLKHIKIVDGSGKVVEDMDITRFYNVDDVLISARDGFKVIYTVERNGKLVEVTTAPTFRNFV